MTRLTDEQFHQLFMRTTDPESHLDSGPMPASTTLLYRLCKGDEKRFEEATRLVRLFVEEALPDTIDRYFEAHITCEPHAEHTFEEFGEMCRMFDWRASRFDEDHVDQIAGKWFASFRHTSHERIVREVTGMVYSLGQADTVVLRYKIEETLLDSKCGDTL